MKTEVWINLIFNNTNDLIFLVEIEANNIFRCVMVNPAYLSHTGFTKDQVVGKTPEQILPPESAEFVLGKYKQAILTKEKIIYEEQVVLSSGLIIVETSLQPIFNDEGIATHLLGVLRDVTKARKNEQALQESEQAFKNIFNLSPIPMLISSVSDGEVIMANESFADTLGYQVSDLIGKKTTEMYPDPLLRKVISEMILEKGRTKNFEVSLKKSDGEAVDFLFSSEVISMHGRKMFLSCFLDITERKKMELALTKSEDNLRTVFDNTEIGYILLDRQLDIRAFNQPANAFSAKDHGRNLDIGGNFFDFFPSAQHAKLRATLDLVFSGEIVEREVESFLPSGEVNWYQVRYSPVLNKENRVLDILMSLEDITERKKAQLSIEESEEKYHSLVEHAEDAIFLLDENIKFTHVNSGLCKLVGYSKEELLDMHLWDIYPAHELERRPLSVEHLKTHKKLLIERKWKRKDGTEVDVEINTRVLDGKGYLNIARNITERKKAEEKLQKSEQRLSYAMTATSDALWEWDYSTGKTFYSPRWYDMLGYEDQEFEMNMKTWENLCHPEDLEATIQKINEVLAVQKNEGYNAEFRMKHKNGSWVWILGRGNVVKRDAESNPIQLSGTNSDITERKRTEEELKKTVSELNDRHNEMMQFSYIVSHNLRAPIASTLGLAQIINLPNVSMDEKLKMTGLILNSVSKMDDLLKDLNNILASQSTLNKSKEKIGISAILESVLGILKQQITDAAAEIEVKLAKDAEEIFTIKAYLESILYNLISNAIKFKSLHRPLKVVVSSLKDKDKLILKVSDNGKGIDLKAHDQNIFGLYKRFHLEVEGKGLGLHMTKLQVEAIGGKIELESEPNKGATFIIKLNT